MKWSKILSLIKQAAPFIKITAKIFTISTFIGFLGLLGFAYWTLDYFRTPGPLQNETVLVIPEGSSVKKIARILSDNNIITYPDIFWLTARFSQSSKAMQAGQYKFEPAITPAQIFDKITSGDVLIHNITIAEGLMTSQILDIISKAPYMIGDVPVGIKEGDLLPETYDYKHGDERSKLVARMKRNMQKTLDKAWEERAGNLPIENKKQALILASIIEKETGLAEERKEVASVFVNRLRKRMRLQTDPTVIYAITQGKYVLERPLRFKDLEIQNPYNTYKNYGLPPGPIANPGKEAIIAALNPANTKYFYFVADGTGGHKFATTLKQHNKNVQNWRRINRKK